MPFNATGIFERIYRWRDDRDANIKIRADRMDEEQDGIMGAINAILGGTQSFLAPIKGQDGTAALPAFTFDGDPTTGVYRKADGSLGFAEGGVDVVGISAADLADIETSAELFSIWVGS